MSMSSTFAYIPCKDIIINRDSRQRKKIASGTLIESIKKHGVYHPIIVKPDFTLVAGECRLAASIALGLDTIPVRFTNELSEVESMLLELDENIRRTDLTWQDKALAIDKIHSLLTKENKKWTQIKTGEYLGIEQPTVALNLLVVEEAKKNEKLWSCGTAREAWNIINRAKQRKAGDAFDELFDTINEITGEDVNKAIIAEQVEISTQPKVDGKEFIEANLTLPKYQKPILPIPAVPKEEQEILNISFLEWVQDFSGQKFNFLHCDFPYGINAFAGKQMSELRHNAYSDQEDVYFALLHGLCDNFDKIMSHSCHMMFWFSAKHREETMKIFASKVPQLQFYPYDLIWHKSCNSGVVGDSQRHPRHTHETALFAYRGGRKIVETVADSYSAPTDKLLHPSTKPVPVLKHFFRLFVDDNTRLFDPTCGSGSALRAAENFHYDSLLGLEIDPEHCANARRAMKNQRLLATASADL